MALTSLGYLLLFLPVSALLCYLIPDRLKNYALFAVNLAFYLLFWRDNLLSVGIAALMDYFAALAIERFRMNRRMTVVILGAMLIKNIGGALYMSAQSQLGEGFLPIGFLVYALTATGYLVDVWRGDENAEISIVDYILFSTLYCKMVTGPLVRYHTVREQLKNRTRNLPLMGQGAAQFSRGLAKLVILGMPLERLHYAIKAEFIAEASLFGGWLVVFTMAVAVFFTLAGYGDIACGVGAIYGLSMPNNFYYPYQSRNISEFLHRFNRTVTEFFRHYVYDRLQVSPDSRYVTVSFALNTVLLCMLSGLWFGIGANYLVWGLYIAFFMILESWFLGGILRSIPALFARIYSFAVAMLSFVIFGGDSMDYSVGLFGAMLGGSGAAYTSGLMYLVTTNRLLLIAGFVFSTSLIAVCSGWIKKRMGEPYMILSGTASLGLLVLSVMAMLVA